MPEPAGVFDERSLRERVRVFADRTHAGVVLADLLEQHGPLADLILAVPTGGVVVAAELARVLHLPVDVAVVAPVPSRGAAWGAVAWDGRCALDASAPADRAAPIAAARADVARRLARFRPEGALAVEGRAVLIVDDGLAPGPALALAAEAARAGGARAVAIAVPTAARSAADRLATVCDGLYVANLRRGPHFEVAEAYRTWDDIAEDDAVAQLEAVRRAAGHGDSGRTSLTRA